MARYWSTLILAGVLAGLGLYLYLVELPDQRTGSELAEFTALLAGGTGGKLLREIRKIGALPDLFLE